MQPLFDSLPLVSINRTVIVREMTAAEVRCLVMRGGQPTLLESDRRLDLLLFSDLSAAEVMALRDEEIGLLLERAQRVSASFFGSGGAIGSDVPPSSENPAAYVQVLEKAVSRLVRCGHANAWSYPWGMMKAAMDEASEETA